MNLSFTIPAMTNFFPRCLFDIIAHYLPDHVADAEIKSERVVIRLARKAAGFATKHGTSTHEIEMIKYPDSQSSVESLTEGNPMDALSSMKQRPKPKMKSLFTQRNSDRCYYDFSSTSSGISNTKISSTASYGITSSAVTDDDDSTESDEFQDFDLQIIESGLNLDSRLPDSRPCCSKTLGYPNNTDAEFRMEQKLRSQNDGIKFWTTPEVPEPFHLSEVMFMLTRDREAFKNMN